MSIPVRDVGTGAHNQIAHAAEFLRRSADRRKVFLAICRGKQKFRTSSEISKQINMPEVRVLQEALKLANEDIIKKDRIKGTGLVYQKYPFYCQHREQIIRLALNKKALDKFPTSYKPSTKSEVAVRLRLPIPTAKTKQVTVDDIDSFSKVRKIKHSDVGKNTPLGERWFKDGLKGILGEEWKFQDWGGEKNDFFSTRLKLNGKRVNVAFALKGRGTPEPLVPKKMGKHGDQIQRLLGSPADVFFVQFWGRIDESIVEELNAYSTAKSWAQRRTICYGIIDGKDTRRIIAAYRKYFP